MKVLQINSVCGSGSTGKICTSIAEILESRGHSCLVAYGRNNVPEEYEKYALKTGNKFGIYASVLMARLFDTAGFSNRWATKKLIEQIKDYAPDIIHLHNLHGYYINIEVLFDYLKKAGIPVLLTLHDCWTFTGHCAHFDSAGCERWKTGCHNCPEKRSYPRCIGVDNSKRNYRKKKEIFTGVGNMTVVGVSRWLAGLAEKSYLNEYPIKTIHNGINLDKFKPTESDFREKYGLEDKKIILGVAQNWVEYKGVEDFVRLAGLVDDRYKIVVVGATDKIRSFLPENILAIDRIENIEQLCEIYTAADVFLNTTKNESFGLANVEALACGTPVVTYRTGGCPEIIDETCGIVTKERTIESAIEAIGQVEGISSDACVARARQFDMNDKFSQYIDLYEEILASKEN